LNDRPIRGQFLGPREEPRQFAYDWQKRQSGGKGARDQELQRMPTAHMPALVAKNRRQLRRLQ
jgi:hypothetical protein